MCRGRGKPQPHSSSQQAWCGNNVKIRGFFSGVLHGAWPTDGQLGLTCPKAVWQTQVGFTQDKPSIEVHLWVLLNLFLSITWADVNLKCKCSLEVGSGRVLSLKCPYRISLLLTYTLFFFFFLISRNICHVWPNIRSVLVLVLLPLPLRIVC